MREDHLLKHEDIETQHVIDRYLMGKLPEDEVAQFEEHYLHCQPCQEALALGQHMQRGFKEVASRHLAETQVVQQVARLAWFWRLRQGALGAALMLALVTLPAAWMWRHSTDLDQQLRSTQATLDAERQQALAGRPDAPVGASGDGVLQDLQQQLVEALRPSGNTRVLFLGAERSASSEPTHQLTLPDSATWIVLALEVEAQGQGAYSAELVDASGAVIWQGTDLQLDAQDTVNLSVHSSSLEPGDYRVQLKVQGDDSAGSGGQPAGTFALRILS